jgi:hypothetical protein
MAVIASTLIKLAFPFMDCRVATAHAMTANQHLLGTII